MGFQGSNRSAVYTARSLITVLLLWPLYYFISMCSRNIPGSPARSSKRKPRPRALKRTGNIPHRHPGDSTLNITHCGPKQETRTVQQPMNEQIKRALSKGIFLALKRNAVLTRSTTQMNLERNQTPTNTYCLIPLTKQPQGSEGINWLLRAEDRRHGDTDANLVKTLKVNKH